MVSKSSFDIFIQIVFAFNVAHLGNICTSIHGTSFHHQYVQMCGFTYVDNITFFKRVHVLKPEVCTTKVSQAIPHLCCNAGLLLQLQTVPSLTDFYYTLLNVILVKFTTDFCCFSEHLKNIDCPWLEILLPRTLENFSSSNLIGNSFTQWRTQLDA